MNEKKEKNIDRVMVIVWFQTAILGTILLIISFIVINLFGINKYLLPNNYLELVFLIPIPVIILFIYSLIIMLPQFIFSTVILSSLKKRKENRKNIFYINLVINFLLCLLTTAFVIALFLANSKDIMKKAEFFSTEFGISFLILSPYIIAWEGFTFYYTKKYFDEIAAPIKENTPLDYF